MAASQSCSALSMENLVLLSHSSTAQIGFSTTNPSHKYLSLLRRSSTHSLSKNARVLRTKRAGNLIYVPVRAQALDLKCTIRENPSSELAIVEHEKDEFAEENIDPPSFKYVEPLYAPMQPKGKLSLKKYFADLLKVTRERLLGAFVDLTYQFSDQPTLYSQRNFAPVNEIGKRVPIEPIEGAIPVDFPKGVYIRNGPNPQFGAKSSISPFGKTTSIWFEGDGMLHAVYFDRDGSVWYMNKYVESRTWKLEKEKGKAEFIPAVVGDPKAINAAFLLNQLRFGVPNKVLNNTNVFQHSGRLYAIIENDKPHEIQVSDLSTLDLWDVNGAWEHPFTSHPKTVKDTGEMVVFGMDPKKPYYVLGVISADGENLVHKVDLGLDRCILSHEVAITERYNIINDYPLTLDTARVTQGGPLIRFEEDSYARIGVMPRYGDAASVKWFDVGIHCTFHFVNSFEDGDEVIIQGCRASGSILPGPKPGDNKLEWFARAFKRTTPGEENDPSVDGVLFTRLYEWRLNMKHGNVKERYMTGTEFSMDMPRINDKFVGRKNKYAYAQVIDNAPSCEAGLPKYGKYVKLHLTVNEDKLSEEFSPIKVEFHDLGPNRFGSEPMFVERPGAAEEDDGWIVTFIHDETTDASEVYIIDAQKFSDQPTARLHLPQRVPYGYHSTFVKNKTRV